MTREIYIWRVIFVSFYISRFQVSELGLFEGTKYLYYVCPFCRFLFLNTPNIFTVITLSFASINSFAERIVFGFLRKFIWTLGRITHAIGDRYLSYRSSCNNRRKIRRGSSRSLDISRAFSDETGRSASGWKRGFWNRNLVSKSISPINRLPITRGRVPAVVSAKDNYETRRCTKRM